MFLHLSVSHSVHRGEWQTPPRADTPLPREQTPPPPGADTPPRTDTPQTDTPRTDTPEQLTAQLMLGDTGNKRAVRILLECILVSLVSLPSTAEKFCSILFGSSCGGKMPFRKYLDDSSVSNAVGCQYIETLRFKFWPLSSTPSPPYPHTHPDRPSIVRPPPIHTPPRHPSSVPLRVSSKQNFTHPAHHLKHFSLYSLLSDKYSPPLRTFLGFVLLPHWTGGSRGSVKRVPQWTILSYNNIKKNLKNEEYLFKMELFSEVLSCLTNTSRRNSWL